MSTPIAYSGQAAPFAVPDSRPSLFKRIVQAMTAARQAQAERYVSGYLARFSDDHLKSLGMTEAEIRAVRSRAGGPVSYWV